jgi:Flp pilus assembly protein TadB
MARQVFVRDYRRDRGEDAAMRILIYGLVAIVVAAGLLLFDDVEVGLPVLNVAVWTVVITAGLFLLTRLHGRRSRRRSRSRSRSLSRHSAPQHQHHIDLKPQPRPHALPHR